VFGPNGYLVEYFFYVIMCVGLIVIMLNILIAIVSETHGKVEGQREVSMYASFGEAVE
jgi:hypothetical protein